MSLSFSSFVSFNFLKASGSPAIIFLMSSSVNLIPFCFAISQISSSVSLGTLFSSLIFLISSLESSSFLSASLSPAAINFISSSVSLIPFSFASFQIYSSVSFGWSLYSLISFKSDLLISSFFKASLSPSKIFWISSSVKWIPFFFIKCSISALVRGSSFKTCPINFSSVSNFSSTSYSS